MKSKIYFMVLPALMILAACDKDTTDDVSYVTTYPEFEVEGNQTVYVGVDEEYVEPGVEANESGTELPVEVSVAGRYSGFNGDEIPNVADQYTVNYLAVNQDGFSGSASRTVYKVNTGDIAAGDLSGLYTSSVVRPSNGESYSDISVMIWQVDENMYELSHGIGGFYGDGRGFGDGYIARGAVITVNDVATNDFEVSQSVFPIWGNVVTVTSFTVDPSTNTITFTGEADFADGVFEVVLVQQQI